MPVPVIDSNTSILAMIEAREYYYQFSATESPTSWAITDGEVPSGMAFDTVTGVLSGTPDLESAGSIYKLHLTATNGSGTSAETVITMGVEYAPFQEGGSIDIEVSLRTGVVSMPLVESTNSEGLQIIHMKRGDVFPINMKLMKDGYPNDLSVTNIKVFTKEFEPEALVTLSNGIWRQIGSGLGTVYQVVVDLGNSALDAILSNYEDDQDTVVDMRCEIQFDYLQDVGTAEPLSAVRTTRSFILRLHRDLGT